MKATLPKNEPQRQGALERYEILDTAPETVYDDIVQLAAHICGTPISLISLLDTDRQWFKARVGLEVAETHRDLAFCGHTILEDGMMVVPDATSDPRFLDNPLVLSDPKIRFYAGAPLITPDGYKLGTLCVIDRKPRDITLEQRNALMMLARQVILQMELGYHVRLLKQRDQEKSQFVSMVSHELRTPLTSILGSLGLLQNNVAGELPEKAKALTNVALRNTERLIRLVNQLLDLGKIESGMMEFHHEKLDVGKLIKESVDMAKPFAEKFGVTMSVNVQPGKSVIESDHDRLMQVLTNLLSNAAKVSPQGATVNVSACAKDGMVHVTVTDHGCGIPESFQSRIFKKFTQADSPCNRKVEGSGLGLSISKAIIEKLGGSIGFTTDPQGTQFFFDLPLAERGA